MKKELDIVIIEDVPADAECILAQLRDASVAFAARRVHNRAGFLAALEQAPPDIVLSDFTLPEFNAIEALHLLKQRRADIPFILVTGNRSEEVAVECIHEGADDYILKASLKRLPTSINNALQRKATEQARALAEQALRRSEELYRLIAENTRDLISLVDFEGRFLYASPAYRASLGYAPSELAGREVLELVHDQDQAALRAAWDASLLHKEGRTVEFRMRHTSGQWRFFESVLNWVFDERGQPQRAVMVCRDITRRKAAEATLRELPRLIQQAQEAERLRVSRELHDSVNQILSAVKFRLQSVEEKLNRRADGASQDVSKAKAHLEKAIQEVRRISRNLRPTELDDLGLVPAVRTLCSEFGERTGVNIDLNLAPVPQELPEDIELHLYRIIQEALGNIEKHSRATRVTLRLGRESSFLRAAIRDNGRGFDTALLDHSPGSSRGMGLTDMKQRAAVVGGSCVLQSTPGTGTEVLVELPLQFPAPPPTQPPETHPGEKGKTSQD